MEPLVYIRTKWHFKWSSSSTTSNMQLPETIVKSITFVSWVAGLHIAKKFLKKKKISKIKLFILAIDPNKSLPNMLPRVCLMYDMFDGSVLKRNTRLKLKGTIYGLTRRGKLQST